jgi:hypothetical protein
LVEDKIFDGGEGQGVKICISGLRQVIGGQKVYDALQCCQMKDNTFQSAERDPLGVLLLLIERKKVGNPDFQGNSLHSPGIR